MLWARVRDGHRVLDRGLMVVPSTVLMQDPMSFGSKVAHVGISKLEKEAWKVESHALQLLAPPNDPFKQPQCPLLETIRPLLEVHCQSAGTLEGDLGRLNITRLSPDNCFQKVDNLNHVQDMIHGQNSLTGEGRGRAGI